MTDAILFACVCVAVGAAYLTGWAHSQIRARWFLDSAAIELRQSDEIAEQWRANAVCIAEIHRCGMRAAESAMRIKQAWHDSSIARLKAQASKIHRRAQRAESATAAARREAVGQRKRADWWRSEAKRLGWKP